MKKMKRQTNFSLSAILDLLKGPRASFRPCMLINEIGIICINGEDDQGAGEAYLLALLTSSDKQCRAISFSFLSLDSKMAARNTAALKKFEESPENLEMMPIIREQLKDKKRT